MANKYVTQSSYIPSTSGVSTLSSVGWSFVKGATKGFFMASGMMFWTLYAIGVVNAVLNPDTDEDK